MPLHLLIPLLVEGFGEPQSLPGEPSLKYGVWTGAPQPSSSSSCFDFSFLSFLRFLFYILFFVGVLLLPPPSPLFLLLLPLSVEYFLVVPQSTGVPRS